MKMQGPENCGTGKCRTEYAGVENAAEITKIFVHANQIIFL